MVFHEILCKFYGALWSLKHQNSVYDFIDIPEFEFKTTGEITNPIQLATIMKWNCIFGTPNKRIPCRTKCHLHTNF
uniref:Uncharacterized protein n=1 Tax=Rhizophagus irregularis (strain DAOM 181602 / DAOM 197198 / MUCL 43194) TaxID=747089 RepID=U9UZF0_RHIID